jgi:hypothetical protein
MILVLIPMLIAVMWAIERHYRHVERAMSVPRDEGIATVRPPLVIVPISRLDRAALAALAYARSISAEVTAVHVNDDPREIEAMRQAWEARRGPVELVILESPYRALMAPLLTYIDAVDRLDPDRPITVVLSELVPRHFWEYPLHNQSALRLKLRLFFRPNTVVIDVPFHLPSSA